MAYKTLLGGNSGDFFNAADSFGIGDDVVYAAYETDFHIYDVRTYGGNDIIDLTAANPNTFFAIYAGSGNDKVVANAAGHSYFDQSGNDTYKLSSGRDFFVAGTGNDKVNGGGGQDSVSFYTVVDDSGRETLNLQGVTLDLHISKAQDLGLFGRDVFRNFEDISGSVGDDKFLGNSSANTFDGNNGDDYLKGRSGDDALFGGKGADILIGDSGFDTLGCGVDNDQDTVRYYKITDSGIGSIGVDVIFDFVPGTDKIDLSRLDANIATGKNDAFSFLGIAAAFGTSSGGEIRLEVDDGSTIVHIDNDGDSATEMNILIEDVTGLTAADFIL